MLSRYLMIDDRHLTALVLFCRRQSEDGWKYSVEDCQRAIRMQIDTTVAQLVQARLEKLSERKRRERTRRKDDRPSDITRANQ